MLVGFGKELAVSRNMFLLLAASLFYSSPAVANILDLNEGARCDALDGESGTCRLLTDCYNPGDFKNIHPPICTFNDKIPVICCSDSTGIKEEDFRFKLGSNKAAQYCKNNTASCEKQRENVSTFTMEEKNEMSYANNFMKELKEDLERQRSSIISEIKESLNELKNELNNKIENLNIIVNHFESKFKKRNIIIFGVNEEFADYWELENYVCSLITDKLGVNLDVSQLDFVRRLGKFQEEKARPILIGFTQFRTKLLILNNSDKLKGTNLIITEDFPKKVALARIDLLPKERDASADVFAIFKDDKLIINNTLNVSEQGSSRQTKKYLPSNPPPTGGDLASNPKDLSDTKPFNKKISEDNSTLNKIENGTIEV